MALQKAKDRTPGEAHILCDELTRRRKFRNITRRRGPRGEALERRVHSCR